MKGCLFKSIKEAKKVLDGRYPTRNHHHGKYGWFFTGQDDGDRRFYSGIGCVFNSKFYTPLPKKVYVELEFREV